MSAARMTPPLNFTPSTEVPVTMGFLGETDTFNGQVIHLFYMSNTQLIFYLADDEVIDQLAGTASHEGIDYVLHY